MILWAIVSFSSLMQTVTQEPLINYPVIPDSFPIRSSVTTHIFVYFIVPFFELLTRICQYWSYFFKALHTLCITNMHLSQIVHLTSKTHSHQQNTSYTSPNKLIIHNTGNKSRSGSKHCHSSCIELQNTNNREHHIKENILQCL